MLKTSKLHIPPVTHPVITLVIALGIVVGIGFWGVFSVDTRSVQIVVLQWFNSFHNAGFDWYAMAVEDYFSPEYADIIVLVLMALIWIFKRSFTTALGFGLAVALAWLPTGLLKTLFQAPRPDSSLIEHFIAPHQGFSSFPSGHVAFSVGIVYAFYILFGSGKWNMVFVLLAIVFVASVAWARMYIGVHYPSDVTASIFAAIAGIVVFNMGWTWFDHKLAQRALAR